MDRNTGVAVANGDVIGRVIGRGYNTSALAIGGNIRFTGRGTWTGSSYPTSIDFYNAPSGSTTPALNLRIDQDGTADFQDNDINNVNKATIHGLNLVTGGELTISSGAITIGDHSYYEVDTESDASTDDLTDINGGEDGRLLILQPINNTRDIVVKATGNIRLNTAGAFTMDLSLIHI